MEMVNVEQTGVNEVVLSTSKEKRRVFREKALSRVGETRINNKGTKMWIVIYNNANDIYVTFENYDKHIHTSYDSFKKGAVSSPYDISLYNKAYLGEGNYKSIDVNGNMTIQYTYWTNMLKRCYSESYLNSNKGYIGCEVANEWLNFQTFAKWFDENYYEISDERMEIEKDLLIKSNKLYSPDTCVFSPKRINLLVGKKVANKGKYPVGVTFNKRINKIQAQISKTIDGKSKNFILGFFDDEEEAFQAYKKSKEDYIKQIANEYKDKIPSKLYNALLTYTVED